MTTVFSTTQLSPLVTATNLTPQLPALLQSPVGHWWVQLFQTQAKLEATVEQYSLTNTLPKAQKQALTQQFQQQLQTLRASLLQVFQNTVKSALATNTPLLTVLQNSVHPSTQQLVEQQQQWITRLSTLLPPTVLTLADAQQLAFINHVVPSVLLQSHTIRLLNNNQLYSTASMGIAQTPQLLEEHIQWVHASSPLAWGHLIQQSLTDVAQQYISTLHTLQTMPLEQLTALLGVLLLGCNYYYHWVTTALYQADTFSHTLFWETEALLFEALQFFNNGSVQSVLWHQQLEKLKPEGFTTIQGEHTAWFEALETAIPSKLHATPKQQARGEKLQEKLHAGRFISAVCDEETQHLWQTLTNPNIQTPDIYSCLQHVTEVPCEMKDMLAATWIYQLQAQVPQWLAWMETPCQQQWQHLTQQLLKLENNLLKSIETALLHKTVLGEEV
jgi:hypothetical protein